MARAKRNSSVLETARQRLAGLKSITPPPDFGANLKLEGYEQQINALGAKLASYNEMNATLDGLLNEIGQAEADMRSMNTRMLAAAEAHYGPDSSEYEQVGGTRTSERKRPARGSNKTTPNKP
jgi:hypothetical protein